MSKKKKGVSVPVAADTVSEEPIPLFLVCDPLLILVISLKSNGLLVTGKVSTKAHRLFRNLDNVF